MKGKRWLLFKLTAIVLVLVSLASAFSLAPADENKFWLMLLLTSGAALAFLLMFLLAQQNLHRFLAETQQTITEVEKDSLYSIPAPAVILDAGGTVIWYNIAFNDLIYNGDEAFGMPLDKIIGIDMDRLRAKGTAAAEVNGSVFRLTAADNDENDTILTIVLFEDITELDRLQSKYSHTRPAVVLITIDDYVDLLQNIKESDKASILVRIEKILENLFEDSVGILKKLGSDRFFAIVEDQHLERMIADKFSVLDKVRAITVNEKMCVTLSIGIGRGASSLAQSEDFAKQALDMSLGRGGDQVSIKTDSGFEFFGGVSQGIEKRTKVKSRIISTAVQELIRESDAVFIMGHRYGDLDSVGSAIGLCGAIHLMGIKAHVVVDMEKNLSVPLIIRVNEHEEGVFLSPAEAIPHITPQSLLIIVDTSNQAIIESKELYDSCERVVVIDHHRKAVTHIDKSVIFHHEPYASSASEMVAELIQYFPEAEKLPAYCAEALMAGIALDTKNFVMKTGVRTFEAAAFLRKQGADTLAVKALFSSSIEAYRNKTKLVSSAEIYNRCAIACSDITGENLRVVISQAADDLLGITGVDASFVMYESNGVVSISARSMGVLNVQVIMETFGSGGGHQTMAAAQIEGMSIEEAKQNLYAAIDEYMRNIS